MILATTDSLAEHEITNTLGVVRGSTVRARHVGRDIQAALRNIVGGEVGSYVEMLENAREEATERMVRQAEGLGANAILELRYATAAVMQGAAEILVYGTAVEVRKI
ncbi:MAG TPA: YbjQ family protein [Chloroflexota bacterium]|nr:YbjQ family protein [Chloroflexota bacterium]